MTVPRADIPNDPREAAAYWFARVHSGGFSQAERQAFAQWRQAAAVNEQEYRALDRIWQATGLIGRDELQALLDAPGPAAPRAARLSRRGLLAGGVSLCTAAVAGAVWANRQSPGALRFSDEYATGPGGQRREILPDGSVLEINTRSRAAVRYFDRLRSIALAEGEIMFLVARDAGRPFVVDAGDATVRVTGTEFSVRRDGERVAVLVQSGSVEVTSGQWWRRERVMLTAGLGTTAVPGQPLLAERADVAALTAWRQGKAVFKDRPLEEVVREMNRYLDRPIRLADSRLKRLSVAGVFNVQDAGGFLRALSASLPVAVRPRADGGVDLSLAQ